MSTITIGNRVAKESGKNEFNLGRVKKISNGKALVLFDRGNSNWCNISGLELVTSN